MTSHAIAVNPLEKLTWTWRGHQICYTVQGTGEPLVLIHGFGASIGHWRKNIPVLAEAGYRVFAIDLLGFGASDKPNLDYCIELWQDLLHDFWHAHIQQPAVMIGNSVGGLLSLMMLADYPHIASGGVLLNSAGGLNHRPEELNPILGLIMGTFAKVVNSDLIGPFMFDQVRKPRRIRNTLKQVYYDQSAITDELVDILYQPSCDPGAQKVFASVLAAPPGPKPAELLPKIEQPLLVLWGDKDPWTPIKGAGIYQDLSEKCDRIQFHPIPNAGHCPHDENPETVNAYILEWLAQR
ncbi:MAG: alpha/beta fold hydrolase [Thainema sp.]